jgi:serine/threonine protein phosphatase PrpC
VGIHHDLNLEAQVTEVEAGDRFLISTDGLYKELTLEHIQNVLGAPFDERILTNLIDEALQRGGKDNITGIIVDVGEHWAQSC